VALRLVGGFMWSVVWAAEKWRVDDESVVGRRLVREGLMAPWWGAGEWLAAGW